MRIEGAVGFVTGANRGIGKAMADALVRFGAKKVYAAVRTPNTITDPWLTPLRLDVTDQKTIDAAAEVATDVTILVNNAGIGGVRFDGSLEDARAIMETHFFGTWAVTRAFAPILKENGGGAIVNVLSAASWWAIADAPGYAAAKAAQWSLTNAHRISMRSQGTHVLGVHFGYVDTDATKRLKVEKMAPATVAEATMRALQADENEVLVDEWTKATRTALAGDITAMQANLPPGL
ncbi:SDR family oxidoreductase [Kibdelosporangium aridum]|uniref:Short-chain dehydrogenase n=1 Tax=Kibdelosporangium aridum TaxID=2030 RepID=A0A1Y5Y035_KIBAR|nr:SDR family oxidoreductase [Kibdelosporangium aridum]SMD22917.1 Short-chain dehydrogenase [Kibdelosporangium aridum]